MSAIKDATEKISGLFFASWSAVAKVFRVPLQINCAFVKVEKAQMLDRVLIPVLGYTNNFNRYRRRRGQVGVGSVDYRDSALG